MIIMFWEVSQKLLSLCSGLPPYQIAPSNGILSHYSYFNSSYEFFFFLYYAYAEPSPSKFEAFCLP